MTDPDSKVFVIDDDPSIRRSLRRLLSSAALNVESFSSAGEFLKRNGYDDVGCLILDVQLGEETGMELQARLAETGMDIPIVFLTGHGDIHMGVQAMKFGAVDFLTKPVDEAVLLEAVRQALAKNEQSQTRRREVASIRERLATMTPREHEVMQYVIAGTLNKQIAAELGIVEKTIKVHRGRMMEKMGAVSVADLVRQCSLAAIEPLRPA